ncbi:CubicO group peptidase, beta-lactamase class C family [Sphingomonas gellani]|uniref:CubicO group peptidase, beta-lactamase class C family n=1 Tax=Sphingomonas gellani TaxID=1166340 RepID=A0A1H8C773_9SPHN|nr:serine hydrolase domain-containing protein [Sphingomonas gellani]SEM91051.1 CubicO group peptidase, beta-lactamase class C family [Sphingomonas gellani]
MRMVRTGPMAAAVLATVFAPAPLWSRQQARPPTQVTLPAKPALPATQALFDDYVRSGKMPGIVAAFGLGGRPTMFVQSGRIADTPSATPAGPDTLWRVYSMTKPITAMAAMLLIEDGRLRLDQPVSDILPAFKSMRVQLSPDTLRSRPAARPITIRNLLTHTAGLGYSIITKGPLLHEYERNGILPLAINTTVEPAMRRARPASLQAFADRVATLPLVADPGTTWSYSIGLDVLAAAVERASGMPFERFVQTRLLTPLGMRSTYWTVPAGQAGRLATNYTFFGDQMVPLDAGATSVFLQPASFPYGGAGLVISARDYDRFLHMLQDGGTLDGVRVMRPETVDLALSNLLPAGVSFAGIGGETGGLRGASAMGFGAGGAVYLADGPGGVPSKGTYGWGGAAGTVAFVDRAKQIRGTIMVNYFPADRWPVREETVRALGRDIASMAAAR